VIDETSGDDDDDCKIYGNNTKGESHDPDIIDAANFHKKRPLLGIDKCTDPEPHLIEEDDEERDDDSARDKVDPPHQNHVFPGSSGTKTVAYDAFLKELADFREPEIAALRLAISQDNPSLRRALARYRDDRDSHAFRCSLIDVAYSVMEQTVGAVAKRTQSAKSLPLREEGGMSPLMDAFLERRYGLTMMLAYLAETGDISPKRGELILDRFEGMDKAVHAAFGMFEETNDATAFVRRLQSI